ncbi:PGF-pre-PGF domain-containing protein, partial [Candidatus Woesearchaeota archaeon]|nr:PGF-pre-PGF domain-containing protein [Candidatus Woesearchaeota archaeon]
MVKRGAVILIVTFLLLCVAAAAVETDQASLELKFAGEDLKAVVGYKNPASIVTPEPRYEWYGIGGKISEITSDKLPRIYFKKGDTIICKYRDTNNAVELRETIEIPNFAPVIENIEPISARQGKIINIVPKVTDVDNDKLFLTFTEPFDEEGRWENTIKYDPGIYTVTVTVSDGQEMVSQEVIVNLTEEYSDERESILERKLEYEDEVAKAELVRARRESKQFSQSKPGIELEFAINNPSIVLSKILFNVNKELLRYNLDIEGFPLSSRPRQYSKAPGQVYQYVETSIFDAENEDFENVSLTFMIGKNWFADNGISQYSVKLYEYFEGEWESMGAAKINDIGDAYTYEVKSDTLEGMYAVSAEGEYLPTGAAVDEDGLDFEIVNDGAGELTEQEALDRAEETELGADEAETEEKEEKESGFLSKAIIAIIILAVLAGLYFVFSGRKTSEDFA